MTTKRNDILPSPGFSDDDSPPASNLSSMQRAIVTIQKLRSKVEHLERARTESIAIIGMACRFPGGANTPEAYFRLLEDGVDAVTEVPAGRWFLEQESADSEGEERSLRWGAFLKDVDQFDATFFGISPREAESLDPQQRLLLEVAWEGLERAGQLPERLMGSKTGVFVGIWSLDYQQRVIAQAQEKLDAYCFTGNVMSTAAGRLAYTFGFQGPCMSVETACSSSLTAIHLACQSLRQGESSLALAGGVNLMLSPTTTKLLSKTQALSPDGRCKSFDARANGFVRGEGCGILVLKRLSDAERDGDTILALVRGSAINQDGRSTGLTAPNVLSQQALLRQALESARLSPQDIGYVETHGTGTSLGDPIEMEAIKAVLGAPREKGATCVIGAVKTNIGHLEAAAGVAGIIKVVLALQNEKIPGNLHFRSLNPRIDIKDTALEIAQVAKPWPPGIRPRFAGVSSFGISGTNAHIIIEEAPRNLEEALFEEETSTCLLPISARTPEALRDQARAFHEMLTSPQSPRLLDIVHTASSRRSHYIHRLSVVGSAREEMAEQLASFLKGDAPSGVAQGQSTPARAKVVFVFSGEGSQWLGMGRQLYESDSSFRSVIDTCDNLMTTRLGWSILDELDATEATSRMGETQVAQPLLFAVQIALVEMLRSWGIAPDAMIGHSVGEIAAAHVAGILSLDEAIRLVALRGRIMQKATGMGKMVSVSMTPDNAHTLIAGYEDRISIAAINDAGHIVLSGQTSAIDDVIVQCERRGVATRIHRTDYASHSPQMDVIERELVERLVRVDTRRASLAMYSTLLADCVDGKELDVRYWARNVRQTVDLAGAVYAAIRDGYQLFLEVGPDPKLVNHIQRCLAEKNTYGCVVGTLQRKRSDRRALLEALGTLYTRGCAIEWARVVPSGGHCVPLPTYRWQRQRFWVDSPGPNTSARSSHASFAKSRPNNVVFIFPGQGSQWLGMGRQLLAEEPEFRATIEKCDAAIREEAGFSILAELQADELTSRLDEIDIVQPVLFAFEIALAAVWRARGVVPDCVVGHSMGEVAAANVAGGLTLEDAVKVICRRSRLLKRIRGKGAMALVELPMAEAEAAIAIDLGKLGIAASNGLRSTVLSGDPEALDRVLTKLEKDGVYCRRIKVDVASHSPHVDVLQGDLLAALHDLHPIYGAIRMQSTVTGNVLDGSNLVREYWWRNLRDPVRFTEVIQALLKQGSSIFIEMSPHPVLLPSVEETIKATAHHATTIASLRRQVDEIRCMDEALETVEALGYQTDRVLGRQSGQADGGLTVHSRFAFLGRRIDSSVHPDTTVWQKVLSVEEMPWLADHRVDNKITLPGAVFIEAALTAARESIPTGDFVIDELVLLTPIILQEQERILIEIVLSAEMNGVWQFKLSSRKEKPSERAAWVSHAIARISSTGTTSPSIAAQALLDAQDRCLERVSLDVITHKQRLMSLHIGRSFEAIIDLKRSDSDTIAHLRVPHNAINGMRFLVHPTLLDAGFRTVVATSTGAESKQRHVLSSVRRILFHESAGTEASCVCPAPRSDGRDTNDDLSLALYGAHGGISLTVEGIRTSALRRSDDAFAQLLFVSQWEEKALLNAPDVNSATGRWLILCDDGGVGDSLRERLAADGGNVSCVYRRVTQGAPRMDRVEIDPGNNEQIASIVMETFRDEPLPRGIVYLWGAETNSAPDISPQSLDAALVRGCGGAIHVIQGLERLNSRYKPRLWLITRGTQMIEQMAREVSVEQAPLWGLGRTIATEASDLRCARVDLDPGNPAQELDMLLRELLSDHSEEEIALRETRRFVGRLERAKGWMPTDRPAISEDATYLVTGGLGGVGLFSAKCLATAGARHIVLVGRHGIVTTEQRNAVDALQTAGVNVEIAVADVSDSMQLENVFRMIDARMPPLRGILHTAGVLEDGFLATQTLERFRRVFAPKVIGGWNLHRLTEKRELDFLIFYSSIAGLLGSPGLGNYVAANTFLDALAHFRNTRGLVGTSVNWGLFGDLGMAAKAESLGGVSRHGIRSFTSEEAEALLLHTIKEQRSQVGVVAIDFRQWLESYPQVASSPRFHDVIQHSSSRVKNDSTVHTRDWLESIAQAAPRARISMVETQVRQYLAEILRMNAARIDRLQPLRELGVDSLMGMELRNRLESALGIRLSATLVYAHPNVGAIAEHILKNFSHQFRTESPAEEKIDPVSQPAAALDSLVVADAENSNMAEGGEDELLALFDQTMTRLESKGDDE